MRFLFISLIVFCGWGLSAYADNGPPQQHEVTPVADYPSAYNEVWTSPSKDAAGSMPLGNGELGINMWVQDDGELRFYLSRTDSFSEISRLLKVGSVRVTFKPNPFAAGQAFRQELMLRDGVCQITAGPTGHQVDVQVFVDSDRPVVHVIGNAPKGIEVEASIDSWRREPHKLEKTEANSAWTMEGAPFDLIESADVFVCDRPGGIGWYHRNETSPAFESTIKVQSLEPFTDKVRNPLQFRTFGGWVTATNMVVAKGGTILQTSSPVRQFALHIAAPCLQAERAEDWVATAERIAAESTDSNEALQRTRSWWHSYWDRAYVITDAGGDGVVPQNMVPLRVSSDSADASLFPGELGRRSVFRIALTDEKIAILASSDPHGVCPVPVEPTLSTYGSRADLPLEAVDANRPFTAEAWIKPAAQSIGRIFEKLNAGRSDGFLLDVLPNESLRWTLNGQALTTEPRLLKMGQWQHVAVVANPHGATRVFIDGKRIAEVGNNPPPATHRIARGYALQRYMQACGGRGPVPIKFNGGIFTVEPVPMLKRPFNADFRLWGDAFWWQNTRHMYHPMAAGGDLEMTDPLFDMYEQARPLAEARTAFYHQAEGAYFPETMTLWGTFANRDYGWNRKGKAPSDVQTNYWRFAWNQGPELVGLMLDRWDYQQDPQFLKTRLLPMARSVLTYFDTRFKKNAAGQIIVDPAQAVETYWTGVINDMPTVSSLIDITTRLAALPESHTTPEQRAFFKRMKAAAPELPLEKVTVGGQVRLMLSAAKHYNAKRSNCENPELYAVWPARLATLATPLLEPGLLAYSKRFSKLPNGWGYDGNVASLLGLADEAGRILAGKCACSHRFYRWPATWGPNFDWLPDQNHGGNLLETTQLMLLQGSGDKIHLLPAWPRKWDVAFKLHAPLNTTVECLYRKGKIESLIVRPESRATDIVLPDFLKPHP